MGMLFLIIIWESWEGLLKGGERRCGESNSLLKEQSFLLNIKCKHFVLSAANAQVVVYVNLLLVDMERNE